MRIPRFRCLALSNVFIPPFDADDVGGNGGGGGEWMGFNCEGGGPEQEHDLSINLSTNALCCCPPRQLESE